MSLKMICPTCVGHGTIPRKGLLPIRKRCPFCNGEGKVGIAR